MSNQEEYEASKQQKQQQADEERVAAEQAEAERQQAEKDEQDQFAQQMVEDMSGMFGAAEGMDEGMDSSSFDQTTDELYGQLTGEDVDTSQYDPQERLDAARDFVDEQEAAGNMSKEDADNYRESMDDMQDYLDTGNTASLESARDRLGMDDDSIAARAALAEDDAETYRNEHSDRWGNLEEDSDVQARMAELESDVSDANDDLYDNTGEEQKQQKENESESDAERQKREARKETGKGESSEYDDEKRKKRDANKETASKSKDKSKNKAAAAQKKKANDARKKAQKEAARKMASAVWKWAIGIVTSISPWVWLALVLIAAVLFAGSSIIAQYSNIKDTKEAAASNSSGQTIVKPETTMVLDGVSIPDEHTSPNPQSDGHGTESTWSHTGRQGIGKVCVELNLKTQEMVDAGIEHTNQTIPSNTYQEDTGLASSGYHFPNYITVENNRYVASGSFGYQYLPAEEEQWYCNMRWNYCTTFHNYAQGTAAWHFRKRLLVTNLTTGKMAVLVIGDFGPGISGRIGGMSPTAMSYLANVSTNSAYNAALPSTTVGNDTTTDYKFEWLVDQTYPVGPVEATSGGNIGVVTNADAQKILASIRGKTSPQRYKIVETALAQIGKPYQWAAAGPSSFDCSGLVMYSYKQGAGINLPHSSGMMYLGTKRISESQLQPGDLVFRETSNIHHVMMYVAPGWVVQAEQTGTNIKLDSRLDWREGGPSGGFGTYTILP